MTDLQPVSEVSDALALDATLLTFIRASQGKPLDERVAMLDGFTNEAVLKWIQQVNTVHSVSGSTFYDLVYHLYVHVESERWTEALRHISSATGRPYESLRKNFNKWLNRNEKELSEEHSERRERALSAIEDTGSSGTQIASAEDGWELDEDDEDLAPEEVEFLREDATPPLPEAEDEEGEPQQDGRRTPYLVAVEEAARLRAEWVAHKADSLGVSDFSERAAESAADRLTSTLEGGLPKEEWKVGTVQGYKQSGYDDETSAVKAEVDWWKRQLRQHGFIEEALKPEVVNKSKSKPKQPSKPKTKMAKLERATEMVREVHQELHNDGVVSGDRVLITAIQGLQHTLKALESLIRGNGDPKPPTAPVTSKSAPENWTPPAI